VVLVKKHFADKALRNRKRKWKLKHMEGFPHMDTESCNDEFQDFANDLEEDPTLRQNVNIYRDKTKMPVDEDDEEDPGCPQITLAEMLDDLDLGESSSHAGDMAE
jgi:nonsense-mediated mRNA decay protein 3